MNEVYAVAERSDGSVAHVAVQLRMRMPGAPSADQMRQLGERGWYQTGDGFWQRDPTDAVIEAEVRRFEVEQWQRLDGLTVLRWRRIDADEHAMFNQHRHHRDAIEMQGDTIAHNMPKARELHRHLLRHQRAEKLLVLDGAYNGAVANGDTVRAAAIEAKRGELRDLTKDPRIDAATTIDELAVVGLDADGEAAMAALRDSLGKPGAA